MNGPKNFQNFIARSKYVKLPTDSADAKTILSILYTNRSITNLSLNNVRQAVMDATSALYSDIKNKEAFVARANASVKMCNYRSAYEDYIEALKLDPDSKGIYNMSVSAFVKIKQQDMLEDIQYNSKSIIDYVYYPKQKTSSVDFNINKFTEKDAIEMMNIVERFELPRFDIVAKMMNKMIEIFQPLPNIVSLDGVKQVIVVGDTHGQLQDVLNIFKMLGNPSPERPYLFNGDYVDRGSQGVEILLVLFAWKIANEKCIYINRGNQYVLFFLILFISF